MTPESPSSARVLRRRCLPHCASRFTSPRRSSSAATPPTSPTAAPPQLWATTDATATTAVVVRRVTWTRPRHRPELVSHRRRRHGGGRRARPGVWPYAAVVHQGRHEHGDHRVRLGRSAAARASSIGARRQFGDPVSRTRSSRPITLAPRRRSGPTLYGLPVAWVGYTTAVPRVSAESFTITVAGYTPAIRDVAARFALIARHRSPCTACRHHRPLGADPDRCRRAMARRRSTDHGAGQPRCRAWQLAATCPEHADYRSPVLVAAAARRRHLRRLQRTEHHRLGMLADGWAWIDPGLGQAQRPDGGTCGGSGSRATRRPSRDPAQPADPGPSIETMVEHGRTYVLAKVPRSMAGAHCTSTPTVSLAVSLAGRHRCRLADEFTAYVFAEPVPFTAQIVDGAATAHVAVTIHR